MESLGKFPDRFIAEIAGQPGAIRRARQAALDQAGALAAIRGRARGHIVFTGMGSSYDACYPIVTALGSAGVAATMLDAAELLHFRLPAVAPDTLVICVSQSGRSAETVRVAEALAERQERPAVVAVTNGTGNPLAALADIHLDTRAGEEHGPSTMTFAATLVMLEAVAAALGASSTDGAEAAALEAERLVAGAEAGAEALAAWLDGRPMLTLLARGGARAAAEMGALTLKEAARFPAESLQAAQFRHGPLELAGADMAAMVFATAPATRALDLGMAAELAAAGAAVLVVGPGDGAPDATTAFPIGELSDCLSPAVAVIPTQLLSWSLARARGLDPGGYTRATKVTERE
jgi:glucosamine--fructose-6-phosphate aminotransferase (isomerizing)